jgi:UDP:flavonoid glycosyltransferase YjiC (YdhE family)
MSPVMQVLSAWRKRWGLKPLRDAADSFSPLAQISQMTRGFDFPRDELPPCFTYAGPLRGAAPTPVSFPWEELDERPLIYASLGTLQHAKREIFRWTFNWLSPTMEASIRTQSRHYPGGR